MVHIFAAQPRGELTGMPLHGANKSQAEAHNLLQ